MDLAHFLDTFFRPDLIRSSLPLIGRGMLITIEIAIAVVATGFAAGFALAIVRARGWTPINALIVVLVDMLRALPPLVPILLVYFGLPGLGVNLPSFAVLWLVLSLVLGVTVAARAGLGRSEIGAMVESVRTQIRAWSISAPTRRA